MRIIFTIICFCGVFYTSAQRCVVADYPQLQAASRPYGQGSPTGKDSRDTLPNEVIVIPVVIHLLYNDNSQNISDQQILSQITALNQDYRRLNLDAVNTPAPFSNVAADTRISFCLAKTGPDGKPTTGIIRKYTKESSFLADDAVKFSSSGGDDAWDATQYLNIWVCNLFGRTLGYAVLPGSPLNKDGVVIKYSVFGTTGSVAAPYNKGRTATHEIGHWLGLRHLWGDAVCGDDGIADTPPQQASNNSCASFPHLSSCSINQYGDMFMNFMDFTDDACMNLFTNGQKLAMRSLFAKGNPKNSFLNSIACDSSDVEASPVLPPVSEANDPVITTYPNPFTNEITISTKDAVDITGSVLKLYNAIGKLYDTHILQTQKTTLYLNNLPSGIYFIRIETGKKTHVYKMLKQSPNTR
ncbi:MAG: M43 family zinc metalloprotease [Ginsengibacter sp.]